MTEQPPAAAWANVVLRLIGACNVDAVVGDLTEEYRIRRRSDSILTAGCWYWRQVVRSLPMLATMAVRRGGWRTVAVAAAAYVLAQLVETGSTAAAFALVPIGAGERAGVSLVIGLLTATLAGYVAESSRSGAATALTAMSLITVVTLMVTLPGTVPMWYQLGFLTLGPVSTMGGAVLSSRRS